MRGGVASHGVAKVNPPPLTFYTLNKHQVVNMSLNFLDITEISGQGKTKYNRGPSADVFITVNSKNKNKSKYFGLCFRISDHLVKEYRLIDGDRVRILFDPKARTGLIQRVKTGGRAVTIRGGEAGARVQLTFRPEMGIFPSASGAQADAVKVDEHGIMFVVPETDCDPLNIRKFD